MADMESARNSTKLSSARKILQMLLAFDEKRPEASVAELAKIVGVPLPTAYRHVALLKDMHLLEEGGVGKYHPTAKLLPIARAAQVLNSVATIASPIVADAARNLGETVMLMQQYGDVGVCIELAECDRPIRFTFDRGHTIPLGVGATGKVLLAMMPESDRAEHLLRLGDTGDLHRELAEVQANAYSISVAELDDGVWACSVPVLSTHERALALTAAGPVARLNSHERQIALVRLRIAAEQLEERIRQFAL